MIHWNFALLYLAGILLLALFGSVVAGRIRKSPLLFYILLGIIAGNLLKLVNFDQSFIEPLSNLGVVFLLFTLGLEFSVKRLLKAGRIILESALGQIIATGLLLTLLLTPLLHNLGLAILIGFGLSMSSTAVVAKLLQASGEDSSLSGEITVNTLLVQDVVSVILVTMMTFLGMANLTLGALAWHILVKVAVVVFSFIFLSRGLEILLSRFKLNREELSLLVFALIFALIGLYAILGVPETTAGFLIGVILATHREHSEIFSQVRLLRDVLLVLFFFFLGSFLTGLSVGLIVGALIAALVLMLLKFLVAWVLYVVQGMHQKTAFWVAFDLMQIGEFAFVLLTAAFHRDLLNEGTYRFWLLATTWSLIIFNLIYRQKLKWYRQFAAIINKQKFLRQFSARVPKLVYDQLDYQDHIVLCGYGRVGNYLGHGLVLSQLPVVVIDTNADYIAHLLKKGVKAIYGDATEPDILDYAQVDKAKFLIISVPNPSEQEQIILAAKRLNPQITIITRTHFSKDLRHFKALGVELIFQPEFEAALSMLKRILKIYKVEKVEISKRLKYLKMEHGTEG